MAREPDDLLEGLRASLANVTFAEAKKVLRAFDFEDGKKRRKNVELWKNGSITYTLHIPHPPGRPMTKGAVRELIRQIEAAKLLREQPSEEEEK